MTPIATAVPVGSSRHSAAITRLSVRDSQVVDELFQTLRAVVADNFGGGLTKPGADFLRRGGNDIVEALPDGFPTRRPTTTSAPCCAGKAAVRPESLCRSVRSTSRRILGSPICA